VVGKNAIEDYFSRTFASRRLTFTFTDSVIAVHGDVAIERLHYTVTARALDAETTEDVGKGIHICTRLVQSFLKCARDPLGGRSDRCTGRYDAGRSYGYSVEASNGNWLCMT